MYFDASWIAASAFGPGALPAAIASCDRREDLGRQLGVAERGGAGRGRGRVDRRGGGRGAARRGCGGRGAEQAVGLVELGLVAAAVLLGGALDVGDPVAELVRVGRSTCPRRAAAS